MRWLVLGLVVIPAAVLAQPATAPAQDALLDRIAGTWIAAGNVMRKSTTQDIEAAWVLGHQYLRLHEVSREKDAQGRPQYDAFIYVATRRGADGEYTCLWLDSTSGEGLTNGTSCHARRDGDRIPFVFRDKDGHADFNTTWTYDRASDSWTWDLANVKDGKPVPFARFKLERKGG